MEDRAKNFNDLVNKNGEMAEKMSKSGEEFFKSAMDLGLEITSRGVEPTECEMKFIRSLAMFSITGLMAKSV